MNPQNTSEFEIDAFVDFYEALSDSFIDINRVINSLKAQISLENKIFEIGLGIGYFAKHPHDQGYDIVLSGRDGETDAAIEAHFEGKGAKALKDELTEVLVATLKPIREKYNELIAAPEQVDIVLKQAMERAEPIAKKTLALAK